jgi:HD-GYP domain-containing protein (c-di-GMP phosphodiesterase class II)
MYGIYRSYQIYLARLEDQKKRVAIEELQVAAEKRHVEEVCALHLRTIEGLALAIDAKDHTTHQHLHRVRTYALEIAKELGLSEQKTRMLFEPRLFCTTSASWLCPITSLTSPAA